MENDEDSQPLLNNVDNSRFTAPRSRFLSAFRTKTSDEACQSNDPSNVFLNFAEEEEESTEPDLIAAVFVVAFDTHCGNIVEWCYPNDVDLDTLEFKAMPSGAHKITSDFIYFRIKNLFGLCCYEKLSLDSSEERGARMKSVGIISYSYTTLFRHMQFLEQQVRHHLHTPGKYEQLVEFFNDHQALLPALSEQPCSEIPSMTKRFKNHFPQMKITHPAGCFMQFIRFFGENVFVLWKLMLLRKRILFFSPPPIGVVCYRVYCTCSLGKVTSTQQDESKPIVPFFYVNVADIHNLGSEMSFVACTTEKIFQDKQTLYDVYVDNQVFTASNKHLKDILKVSKVDKQNYQNLLNFSWNYSHRDSNPLLSRILRNDFLHQRETGDSDQLPDEDRLCQSFFTRMNNQLFQILCEVSTSQDRTLTADHLQAMGLDPSSDRLFVMDLLELYSIDVMLVVDNPCCPE